MSDEKPKVTLSGLVAAAPRDVVSLAERIAVIHGKVVVTKESGGWHLNFASPEGLKRDGRVELSKRHGSLNASKFLLIDKYQPEGGFSEGTGKKSNDAAAQCMKYSVSYKVTQLLMMEPLEKRGIPEAPDRSVMIVDASRGLVEFVDAHGYKTLVPEKPGATVCVTTLEDRHPCIEFLRRRGFTAAELKAYCRATYCTEELEADADKGRYYGWMPGGFRATPQGRLILNCDINGIPRGWQARILEKDVGPLRMFWHPYENRWVHVLTKDAVSGKHVPLPSMCDNEGRWEPQKYKNAFGAKRNEQLLGYDHANMWNIVNNRGGPKTAVVVEGPLTGAAVRGPGIALTGKHMSDAQARLIANRFDRIILVPDADDVGQSAVSKWVSALTPYNGNVSVLELPREFDGRRTKDVADFPVQYVLDTIHTRIFKP